MVLSVKDLAGYILNRVVLYILQICIARQMASAAAQPFQTQLTICNKILRLTTKLRKQYFTT
jgi:hypothetical protein